MKQLLTDEAAGSFESLAEFIAYLDEPLLLIDGAGVVRGATEGIARELRFATPREVVGRPLTEFMQETPGSGDGRRSFQVRDAAGATRAAQVQTTPAAQSGSLLLLRWDDCQPDRAAALAHDLRSPLCAVIGFARLARDEFARGNPSRALEFLARVERCAGTIDGLVQGALRQQPADAADLSRVVEEIRAERKPELERRSVQLISPLDPPQLACAPSDLYRVLSNLIGNALDHMGARADAEIRVSAACAGELATVTVRDNGDGLDPSECKRIFAAGHSSAHGDASRPRGLGLAIVRELAASWHGRVWAESERGAGAALHVTIPLAR